MVIDSVVPSRLVDIGARCDMRSDAICDVGSASSAAAIVVSAALPLDVSPGWSTG